MRDDQQRGKLDWRISLTASWLAVVAAAAALLLALALIASTLWG